MRIDALSLHAGLGTGRSRSTEPLNTQGLDPSKRHWRITLPALIPRRSRLAIFATYREGDGSFGARLAPRKP
jgi:hypothetical protein